MEEKVLLIIYFSCSLSFLDAKTIENTKIKIEVGTNSLSTKFFYNWVNTRISISNIHSFSILVLL